MLRAVILIAPGTDPLRQVAGLDLLRRCMLTVRSWGTSDVVVMAPGDALPMRRDADLLFVSASTVYDRRTGAALGDPPVGGACRAGGAVRVHASAARQLELTGATQPEEVVAGLCRLGIPIEERSAQGLLYQPALDDAEARLATRRLFESCRKPIDGIVSRNINRHVSLWLSRRLVATRVHPNHVSVLCIALGALAALLVLGGSYGWVLAGAAVFQLNSILDGVDGELARVRWQQSRLGELLDSAGDNFSNFAYFTALAWVAAHRGHALLAALGAAGLALWAAYLVFLYSRLYGTGRGDVMLVTEPASGSPLSGLIRLGRTLLRRDSFVMLALLLAAAGRPFWMLPVMLLGGASVFGYAASQWSRALVRRFATEPGPDPRAVSRARG